MDNLTEIDQLMIVCMIAGFISGALYAIIDDVSSLLIENRRIYPQNLIKATVVTGFSMGVIACSLTFVAAVMTNDSTEELMRSTISTAIAIAFAPLILRLFRLISLRLFPKNSN
ncbi:MAG: hypothetical protein AAFQ80_11620 [Cyanobacteria bacterium J06621_8]